VADYSTIEIRGDNEPLQEALDESVAAFEEYGELVIDVIKRVAGVSSWDELTDKIKAGIDAFEQADAGGRRLEAQLRVTGRVAGFTRDQMAEMAREIRKVSGESLGGIQDAQRALAKFTNVRVDVFQDALIGASDLAFIMETSMAGAARFLGEALQDPREGLKMLEAEGVKFTKAQERLVGFLTRSGDVVTAQRILLQQLAATYGGEGATQAQTFSSRLERLNEASSEIWETIGGALVPWLNKLIDIMEASGRVVTRLIDKWTEGWDGMAFTVEDAVQIAIVAFDKLVSGVVYAFTYAQTVIEEWESFFEGTWHSVRAYAADALAWVLSQFVDWGDKIKGAVPAVQSAFLRLWDYVVDVAKAGVTTLSSLWDQFVEYTKKVWRNIEMNFRLFYDNLLAIATGSGGDHAWSWKPMVDGFKAAVEELPRVAEDVQDLLPEIPGMGQLIEDLEQQAEELRKAAEDAMKPFDDAFSDNLARNSDRVRGLLDQLKALAAEDPYRNTQGTRSGAPFKDPTKKSDDERGQGFTAAFEDLVQLNRRIQAAAARPPEVRAIEEQTQALWKQHFEDLQVSKDMAADIKTLKTNKDPINKGGVAVFAP
jgi:hypothetical protein